VAGIITAWPGGSGKAVMAQGNLSWGQSVAGANDVVTMPLRVAQASNITSFEVSAKIGTLGVDGIKTNLPKDWMMFQKVDNGTVTVVAAGVTPITDGDVATFVFKADSKNPSVKIEAEVLLNENNSQMLSAVVSAIPTEFALKQNYPNPFNPTTTIKYQLPQDSKVTLVIYNTLGQVVRTLVNEDAKAGYYTMQWDGRNDAGTSVSTGMYIYRISAGNFTAVKKMTLMK
jgi:hypothetical protein